MVEGASQGEFVFDRTPHISNPIYAANGGRDGFIAKEDLEERLLKLNPVLIYCRTRSPDRMLTSCMESRGKPWKTPEQYEVVRKNYMKILEGYEKTFASLSLRTPVFRYDYEFMSVDELMSSIAVLLEDF